MPKIVEALLRAALPVLETVVLSILISGFLLLLGVEHITGATGMQAILFSASMAAIVSIATAGHILLGSRISWLTTALSSIILGSSYLFAGLHLQDWLFTLVPALVYGLAAHSVLKTFLDNPESTFASLKSGAIQGAGLYVITVLLALHADFSLAGLVYYGALGALASGAVTVAMILHFFGADNWGQGLS